MWKDSTPATNDDLKLWNEYLRTEFDNRFSGDNVAYLDVYFNNTQLWTNTFLEVWVFVDWVVGTPDSWFLFSRININEEFTWVEEMSINASFTIV